MQKTLFDHTQTLNIVPFDGEALFYPDFLNEEESRNYFNHLLTESKWEQLPIKIYDKEYMQPRLTAFYGEEGKNLDRSGLIIRPQPWTDTLLKIKEKAESLANVRFTHALLNMYRDGKDSVSWHRDSDKAWGIDPVIGSVSLGAARTFQLRNYKDKKITRSIVLTPGSFLLMRGTLQRFWEHQVPKTNKRIGTRINITFRILK